MIVRNSHQFSKHIPTHIDPGPSERLRGHSLFLGSCQLRVLGTRMRQHLEHGLIIIMNMVHVGPEIGTKSLKSRLLLLPCGIAVVEYNN